MSVNAGKFAPITAVVAVLVYLAWPYLDEPDSMRKPKDAPKRVEMPQALLKPPVLPALERNPFAASGDADSAAPAGLQAEAAPAKTAPARSGGIGEAPIAKAGGIGGPSGPKSGGIGDSPRPKSGGIGGGSGPRKGGIGESSTVRKGGIGESSGPRKSGSGLPASSEAFVLNGTFLQGENRLAIINGGLYEQGQKIAPEGSPVAASITRIELDKVLLEVDGKAVELKYSDRISKPSADAKGSAAATLGGKTLPANPPAPADRPLPAVPPAGEAPAGSGQPLVPAAGAGRGAASPAAATTIDDSGKRT